MQETKPKRKAPPLAWKPGQSGNPKGRRKSVADFREMMKRDAINAHIALSRLMNMPWDELMQFARNQEGSANEMLTASVLMKAIEDGCPVRYRALMDRFAGKPVEQVVVNAATTDAAQAISHGSVLEMITSRLEAQKSEEEGGVINAESKEKDDEKRYL